MTRSGHTARGKEKVCPAPTAVMAGLDPAIHAMTVQKHCLPTRPATWLLPCEAGEVSAKPTGGGVR
jgi:hypothetical protein